MTVSDYFKLFGAIILLIWNVVIGALVCGAVFGIVPFFLNAPEPVVITVAVIGAMLGVLGGLGETLEEVCKWR